MIRFRIYFWNGRPFFFKMEDGLIQLPFEVYVINKRAQYEWAEIDDVIPLIGKVNLIA